jgi:hypothetical protein
MPSVETPATRPARYEIMVEFVTLLINCGGRLNMFVALKNFESTGHSSSHSFGGTGSRRLLHIASSLNLIRYSWYCKTFGAKVMKNSYQGSLQDLLKSCVARIKHGLICSQIIGLLAS